MGIFFVLLAALLTSISNYTFRRSIDAGGSSKGYLITQLFISFFVMVFLNPVRTGEYSWNTTVVLLGLAGGLIFGLMMWGLGKSLELGPPGLSLAFLNTASIVPAVFLALIFGLSFGHGYTKWNALGSILVVSGLFWAGWTSEGASQKTKWLIFALFVLVAHSALLFYFQWWALILDTSAPGSPLIPFHVDLQSSQWFMPAVLFGGTCVQLIVYLKSKKSFPSHAEFLYGLLGGITNGASTFFLILAPQKATAWENPMLFPIFSVFVIMLCNTWAQLVYKEAVNWKASALCVLGLIIGTALS